MMMKKTILLVLASALLLPYQNCSRASFGSRHNQEQKPAASLNENGTGYGGKVYIAKQKANDLCPDGTKVRGRFKTLSATTALVEKEDCQDLNPPRAIDLTATGTVAFYSTRPESPFDFYIYNEWVYETALPATPTHPVSLAYACYGGNAKLAMNQDNSGPTTLIDATVFAANGNQAFMPSVNLTGTASTKHFDGANGGDTLVLDIDMADNWSAVFSYTGSVNISSNMQCFWNY